MILHVPHNFENIGYSDRIQNCLLIFLKTILLIL